MRIATIVAVLGGCAEGPVGTGDGTSGTDTGDPPTGTPTDTDTIGTTPTTPTTPTTVPQVEVDCTAVPTGLRPYAKYTWAPSAEDFTFSADGYMFSITGGALKRTPYGGGSEVLVPGLGDARGTRFLPDGRVAIAHMDTGSVKVVDPATGSLETVAASLANPNGIAIGADGRIYVATTGQILRIDPETLDVEVVVDLPGNSFDGLTFSPDYRRLYFNEEVGQVHWVDFDDDGVPGPPSDGIDIPNGISLLDGMAMDACGNLYVIVMNGKVWRIWADTGELEQILDVGGLAFIPALNFGLPPTGGWGNELLYVLDFTGSLYEVDVGVPGKWEPHLPAP